MSLEQNNSEIDINETLNKFSESLFSCSDNLFGKNIRNANTSTHTKQNKWFNENCRSAKREFNRMKHIFAHDNSQQNRVNFVKCRTKYNKVKRKAKQQYKRNEGKKLSDMAKSNPKAFWKRLKKYSANNKMNSENLTANDFAQHFTEVFGGEQNLNNRNVDLDFNQMKL